MERQNSYFVSLSLLLMFSTAFLAAIGDYTLDVYVSVFTICYFVTSTVFRPRRLGHDFLGIGLFAVFVVIVAERVLSILAP
jgi:hypothetical protein